MAVVVDRGKVYLSAGPQISIFPSFDLNNLQQIEPFRKEISANGDESANQSENGEKSSKQNGKKNGVSDKVNVVCFGISDCSDYIAFCGENKALKVYHKDQEVNSTTLTRKASKIVFTKDAETIVIADKNGDVYKYDFKSKEENNLPKLVLGHLSMLLDLQLTPSNRYILTADRDEKIRISYFPNGYNINNFCLGHTDFVTSISLLSDDTLISGSGDGTVRIWKFLKGEEIAVREVYKDVDIRIQRNKEPSNVDSVKENLKEMDIDQKRNQLTDHPAVIKVKPLQDHKHFLAQVEELNGLLLYSLSDNSIELVETLNYEETLVDFDVDSSNTVICLTRAAGSGAVVLKSVTVESGKFGAVCSLEVPEGTVQLRDEELGDLTNLHKRWFDNMKDYLERKQIRIENSKNKPEVPAKKQKLEA